jgi:hypothetical protein
MIKIVITKKEFKLKLTVPLKLVWKALKWVIL